MYENYSRQALPSREYRELLGSALCVFNSNNAFIIENILRNDEKAKYNWYDLIDRTSGRLKEPLKETITNNSNQEISLLFSNLIEMRNRIVHSFQITDKDGEQRLATKNKDTSHTQFIITEDYLLTFIKSNETLSSLLHNFRGF